MADLITTDKSDPKKYFPYTSGDPNTVGARNPDPEIRTIRTSEPVPFRILFRIGMVRNSNHGSDLERSVRSVRSVRSQLTN